MSEKKWMIYGCYGYTGRLMAAEAVSRGLVPVLAGRDKKKVGEMARQLGFPFRCFEAETPRTAAESLAGMSVLLNCAGPFVDTCVALAKGCMLAGVHYLDISGEIDALEYVNGLDEKAMEAGVVLCPGAGFDVVPTDCMASALKESMPDAERLALAFDSTSPPSPGTVRTMLDVIADNGKVRKRKVIVERPIAHKSRRIDFGAGPKDAVAIPWGDVSTAFHSTGIPDIEVYVSIRGVALPFLKVMRPFRCLLFMKGVRRLLNKIIDAVVKGPSPEERQKHGVRLWAEATDADGRRKNALLETANGYDVTVHAALGILEKLLETNPEPGAYTPSRLMGAWYACGLPGSGPIRIFS